MKIQIIKIYQENQGSQYQPLRTPLQTILQPRRLFNSAKISGMTELDEFTMEKVMEDLERRCYDNMNHAIENEEGLGIEYDEDVVCDVCQSPDGEDDNEMVFCDKCNICVHQ
eukprot:g42796.t1